jgi:hypothetical protein
MTCSECRTTMLETEPQEDDVWFGEPAENATVYCCPRCQALEAEAV